MLVGDLMTTEVVTVDRTATLREASQAMLETGVGSVLVTSDGTPTGIVTETDAMAAACAADAPVSGIDVTAVMSSPLETIGPDASVRAAVDRMLDAEIKKLPVVDGVDLRGIVTTSDVVGNYHAILREARDLEERRGDWESQRPFDVGAGRSPDGE